MEKEYFLISEHCVDDNGLLLRCLPEKSPSIILEIAYGTLSIIKQATSHIYITILIIVPMIVFAAKYVYENLHSNHLLQLIIEVIGIIIVIPTLAMQRIIYWAWLAKLVIPYNKKMENLARKGEIISWSGVPQRFKWIANVFAFLTVIIPFGVLFSIWTNIKYFID